MDKMEMQEMISALADGQLRGEALERVIQTVATDAQARNAWHTYHLIGDVLRSGDLPTGTPPATFLAKFQVRLERERAAAPLPVADVATDSIAEEAQPVRATATFDPQKEAANDGSFRWKMVAGLASIAAVAAIGWTAIGGLAKPEQAQLAAVPPGAGTAAPAVMIRDARLDEMLAAHRQFGGGASALQTPAGFLRNATFEGPAR
jgi:sigma-E factor negative regulatory protein RseA